MNDRFSFVVFRVSARSRCEILVRFPLFFSTGSNEGQGNDRPTIARRNVVQTNARFATKLLQETFRDHLFFAFYSRSCRSVRIDCSSPDE